MIIIVGVFFVFGFIENIFWFRRLMLGWWVFWCGMVCWWFIVMLFMIFVIKYEVGRNVED